ncbi:TetR/AcrR family transcriptional regulator [Brevundimonas sp.]|uniref:TetR/AcrR family transcriptional regulator n=1 Tax=Brevundimonas sp. TaxID=1871086 RepID=UPI002FC8786C
MSEDAGPQPAAGGLRERKRRATLGRITDAGISLFIEKGYDSTTLDDIAVRAGISRRTFFYYFKSKDEILLSAQSGMGEMIVAELRNAPDGRRPLDAIRDAIIKVCERWPAAEMVTLDRLMRSSPVVQARKQASYVQHERTLFEALRERWPDPGRETGLKLVAMLGMGAMRLAFDTLSLEGGERPVEDLLHETFDALDAEL